ncbi:MAG: hypothetical protein KatS3mg112_1015 [Thermogutta sp.]|nr:MAG: hypothetical protein KatS3mg112_1015 [Thermogutta sp.]
MVKQMRKWAALAMIALVLGLGTKSVSVAWGAEAGGGHGEESSVADAVNPLDFRQDLALWTAVVFVGVLVVLRVFAWKPIARALDQREDHIRREIEDAERANAEAKRLLSEYQAKLGQAENEIRAMIEKAKQDAQQVGQSLIDKARQEAEEEYRRKLAEIDRATERALQELAQRGAALAVDLAGKLVAARLDPTAHARMIEQAMEAISRQHPPGLN